MKKFKIGHKGAAGFVVDNLYSILKGNN